MLHFVFEKIAYWWCMAIEFAWFLFIARYVWSADMFGLQLHDVEFCNAHLRTPD